MPILERSKKGEIHFLSNLYNILRFVNIEVAKMEPDINIERRIVRIISESTLGMNISETAKMAETTRITALKHLERLKKRNVLSEVKKGRMRIFCIVKRERRSIS